MKIEIYFDVWPGQEPGKVSPFTGTREKYSGTKRYKVECEIPDPNEPDEVLKLNATEVNQ